MLHDINIFSSGYQPFIHLYPNMINGPFFLKALVIILLVYRLYTHVHCFGNIYYFLVNPHSLLAILY